MHKALTAAAAIALLATSLHAGAQNAAAAGFADADLHPFAAPDHPKEGGLVAFYPGRDPKLRAILNAAGIPTYGIEPLFAGPDLGHIHGLNEYISVKSLLDCRAFLFRLIKIYSDQK
jgi:hypothetical protein